MYEAQSKHCEPQSDVFNLKTNLELHASDTSNHNESNTLDGHRHAIKVQPVPIRKRSTFS